MSARHGYIDDNDDVLQLGRWRGMVKSATRGKRGQRMLADLRDALDAMPEKRLVEGALQTKEGDLCAIGCVLAAKGKDYTAHEDDDEYDLRELNESIAHELNVAECLVQEVEWHNDECGYNETPEQRWTRMRAWVEKQINKEPHHADPH